MARSPETGAHTAGLSRIPVEMSSPQCRRMPQSTNGIEFLEDFKKYSAGVVFFG
jgi:hypothetical protein